MSSDYDSEDAGQKMVEAVEDAVDAWVAGDDARLENGNVIIPRDKLVENIAIMVVLTADEFSN